MNTKINEPNSNEKQVQPNNPPEPASEKDKSDVGASQKPQDFGEFAKAWKGVDRKQGVPINQPGEKMQNNANPFQVGNTEQPGNAPKTTGEVLDEMGIGESGVVSKNQDNPLKPVQKEQPKEEGKEGSNPFKEFGDEGPDLPDYPEDLKQIEALFEGFINRGELVVMKADPGVGASLVALDMGLSTAKGVSLYSKIKHMKANGKQNTVIFIERGMSYSQILGRQQKLAGEKKPNNLTVYSADHLRHKDPSYSTLNLASASVQQELLSWASKYPNLIMIFDRLSSLVVPSPTDKVPDFHNWVIKMKEKGVTMIWVHQGKNGSYDLPYDHVDTELKLSSVPNRPHLAIKVEFIRARSLPKSSTLPFVIELQERENEDGLHFVYSSIEADKQITTLVLAAEGEHTQSQIASKLKVSQGTISNWLRQAEIEKLIKKQGRNIWLTKTGKEATKNCSRNFNY